MRTEKDFIGELEIPEDAYWGIHTARSVASMSVSGNVVPDVLIHAFAVVKSAAAQVNGDLGYLKPDLCSAIVRSCKEVSEGLFDNQFPVDALQGGAGTSTNMNVNEVIAARAAELLGASRGDRLAVSPIEHVNLHQSTNDVYPTALRLAAILQLRELANSVATLQGAFQRKEKAFARIVKIGRTETQDAVPMTLGQEFGSFAEAISRDRWRTFKCEERLRVVNLGGTAIGTGLTAPREYIFRVVEKLREISGVGFARGENLTGETAHADALVEVSGILKALSTNLVKISNDIRTLNMLRELSFPPMQAGSSIMPGKVNPVICEMVAQCALKAIANDFVISDCASRGTLQINEFLPLIASALLESLRILNGACVTFAKFIDSVEANEAQCALNLRSSDALITTLVPSLGYEKCSELICEFRNVSIGKGLYEFLCAKVGASLVEDACKPDAVLMLGFRVRRNVL